MLNAWRSHHSAVGKLCGTQLRCTDAAGEHCCSSSWFGLVAQGTTGASRHLSVPASIVNNSAVHGSQPSASILEPQMGPSILEHSNCKCRRCSSSHAPAVQQSSMHLSGRVTSACITQQPTRAACSLQSRVQPPAPSYHISQLHRNRTLGLSLQASSLLDRAPPSCSFSSLHLSVAGAAPMSASGSFLSSQRHAIRAARGSSGCSSFHSSCRRSPRGWWDSSYSGPGGSRRGYQTAAEAVAFPRSGRDEEPTFPADLFDSSRRSALTPGAIVERLDRYIVGQADAKRAVAIALRNRWRRSQLDNPLRDEIMPKNILMIGPTGCGKTEIARRLAKLADAPFLKVEATKYTELGYVGRDVDEIVQDLVESGITLVKSRLKEKLAQGSAGRAESLILDSLVGIHADESTRATYAQLYRKGELDNQPVEVDALSAGAPHKTISVDSAIFSIVFDKASAKGSGASRRRSGSSSGGGSDDKGKKMTVAEARAALEEAHVEKMLSSEQVVREAIRAVEQDGIVFIDEIDKVVEGSGRAGHSHVSAEGVQRDLLPIIEGSTVTTKHGDVSTDHVLFICSGAFHSSKPSDMLAELQGRLPIRVELKGLSADDFYRILTEPDNNMIKQQQVLLDTEGITLQFTDGAIKAACRVAEDANRFLDNIGARRLHTVLERILGDVSFNAPELAASAKAAGRAKHLHTVDEAAVVACMEELMKRKDLSRYVL